jgi:hypothetical protein
MGFGRKCGLTEVKSAVVKALAVVPAGRSTLNFKF